MIQAHTTIVLESLDFFSIDSVCGGCYTIRNIQRFSISQERVKKLLKEEIFLTVNKITVRCGS